MLGLEIASFVLGSVHELWKDDFSSLLLLRITQLMFGIEG